MSNRKKKATTSDRENDEVEELLRAAEEDIFLKINLNSHTLRGSSSHIIPSDLDRRFQSLKSNTKSQPHIPHKPHQINTTVNTVNDDDGDLLGRFEALKKTLPSYQDRGDGGSVGGGACVEEGEEEDEVEKVIRWAIDAVRLDPGGDDESDEESDDDYDSDESGDNVKKRQKDKGKGKGKGSKKK